MAAPNGIAFRDLQVGHSYKLSQMPQTIPTAIGLSAAVIQDLRELYFTPSQVTHINCANNNCAARFRRTQADAFGSTSFTVYSSHLQNGTMTRFIEERPAPAAAGASGGAKRKVRKSKKTRKSKKSRKSRKIRK
jgi:hypothetical protein